MHRDSLIRFQELQTTEPAYVRLGIEAGKMAVQSGLIDSDALAEAIAIMQDAPGAPDVSSTHFVEQMEAATLGILAGVEELQGREVQI